MESSSKIISYLFIITILIIYSCNKDESPTSLQNHLPKIESLTANPNKVLTNEEATLTCIATDEDGDNLTITWSSKIGSFPVGAIGVSVKWKAPSQIGVDTIVVIVNDGKQTVQEKIELTILMGIINYGGKNYNAVQIGTQWWLKENLDIGTMVPNTVNQSDNGITEKYCYDNKVENCITYGGLYTWDEAMAYTTVAGAKGICPDGWHIPSNEDFSILVATVNNDNRALKANGVGSADGIGTNTSGFSALLAGGYGTVYSNTFGAMGYAAYFIRSEKSGSYGISTALDGSSKSISTVLMPKTQALSIRCIKN